MYSINNTMELSFRHFYVKINIILYLNFFPIRSNSL